MAFSVTLKSGLIIGLKMGDKITSSPPLIDNTHSIEIGGNVMRQ